LDFFDLLLPFPIWPILMISNGISRYSAYEAQEITIEISGITPN
jgi:tryptophan-rich sensory protein